MKNLKSLTLAAIFMVSAGAQAGVYPMSYMYQIGNSDIPLVTVDNFGDNYEVCLDIAIQFNKDVGWTKFTCYYDWSKR